MEQIIYLFNKNIKGKRYIKNINNIHDGCEGHWLEKMMNLKLNSNNEPDIGGYEMKKNSKKITFGDWTGNYLFSQKNKKKIVNTLLTDFTSVNTLLTDFTSVNTLLTDFTSVNTLLTDFTSVNTLLTDFTSCNTINNKEISLTKEQFIKFFGNRNDKKENRYSWSGSCIPKYGKYNDCGQILKIDENKNIVILYSYKNDKRKNIMFNIIPEILINKIKNKEICIAIWSSEKMKKYVENKFNQKGFFICKKDKNNIYNKICFGSLINHDLFIEKIKSGDIFFDSGMYFDSIKPNDRLYSHWRANNKFWNNLLIEEF